jgi:hypothetical protein
MCRKEMNKNLISQNPVIFQPQLFNIMLKHIVFISTILLFALTTTIAQSNPVKSNPAKDSIINKMCDCITSNPKLKNAESAEEVLQECMMKVIEADPIGVLMDLGLEDFEDQEKAQQFGQEIGLELIKNCPALRSIVTEEMAMGMKNNTAGMMNGKLVKLESETFQFIVVDDGKGTQSRLLWLQPFKNADQFMSEGPKLIGKNISVKWKEIQIYSPKTKTYSTYKEIMAIDF